MQFQSIFIILAFFAVSSANAQTSADLAMNTTPRFLEDSYKAPPEAKTSLFDHIYNLEGTPKINIKTDIKQLIGKKMLEEYQSSHFELSDEAGAMLLNLKSKIKTRGNMRKKVSALPPVKLDFKKSTLDSLGFLKLDDLKMVFPCTDSWRGEERLLKEFLLYELYGVIDSNSIRARLVDVTIENKNKIKYDFKAFIVEDKEEYARRKSAKVIERGVIQPKFLDREAYTKMIFFQYMIANTDYSVKNKHNLELVKVAGMEKLIAVPYDFDYAGFVDQDYAVPHEVLPIDNIHDRYVSPAHRMTEAEFYQTLDYFVAKESEIYDQCDRATYLSKSSRKQCKLYLAKFFKALKKPAQLKKQLVRKS